VSANCAGKAFPNSKSFSYSSSINSLTWILDSGASKYMTYDASIMFNIKPVNSPLHISLPNSHKIKVTHWGNVRIFPNLILSNVLYVPSFRYNLLSIQKLCNQFNCLLIFSSYGVIIQGPSMKRFLVLGEVKKGLYILKSS